MDLTDYETPTDPYAPRARASQSVAAAHRQRTPTDDQPTTEMPPLSRGHLLIAAIGIAAVVGVLTLAVSQLSGARPLQITPEPSSAPAQAFEKQPLHATSAPTSAPTAMIAPTAPPVPTTTPIEPQTEQILTYVEPPVIEVEQPAPATGEKEAPDRAAHHAAAVARDQQPHGQKVP